MGLLRTNQQTPTWTLSPQPSPTPLFSSSSFLSPFHAVEHSCPCLEPRPCLVMSGSNPFRHNKSVGGNPLPPAPSFLPREEGELLSTAHPSASNPTPPLQEAHPAPRTKSVRIASPPAFQIPLDLELSDAEDSPGFKPVGAHRGSPPPAVAWARRASLQDEDDPFSPGSSGSELDDDSGDGSENAEIFETRGRKKDKEEEEEEEKRKDQKGNRRTMDVDAFKRLLLTGDAGLEFTSAPATKGPDLQSASGDERRRSGIYMSDSHIESPRRIPSQDEKEKRSSKQPPPPPKSRRGKPIQHTTQTDSAVQKTASILSSSPEATSGLTQANPTLRHPPRLSPPDSPAHTNSWGPPTPDRRAAALSEPTFKSIIPLHKRAPTPPVARRHSQIKRSISPNISRTNSTKHQPSINTSNAKHPPPPPSRRTAPSSSSSSITPPSDTSPQPKPSFFFDLPTDSYNHQRRGSTTSATSSKRHSTISIGASPPCPPSPSASMRPPKPPPPRRTGASSNAGSLRRVSMYESLDEHRGSKGEEGSLKGQEGTFKVEEGLSKEGERSTAPTPSNASHILADLSRLQQELDQLRGRYEAD
ncbi:hypothetical protein FQN57_005656 [Myotisia sp. PD_48]|nr:hypothetical protein FQN57_005656 [Myotisia sp. PD_48]